MLRFNSGKWVLCHIQFKSNYYSKLLQDWNPIQTFPGLPLYIAGNFLPIIEYSLTILTLKVTRRF